MESRDECDGHDLRRAGGLAQCERAFGVSVRASSSSQDRGGDTAKVKWTPLSRHDLAKFKEP
jgi:hypothetical protein